MLRLKYSLWLLVIALLWSCSKSEQVDTPTEYKQVLSKEGMVVCANPLAAQVGVDILAKGGNAFDAAVAVQFALAVVYPRAGNIGGGGFAVYHDSKTGQGALDFREMAPLKADQDMYLDDSGQVLKDLSTKGILAAGVPGVVAGMVQLHKKFGILSWSELLEDAIKMAEEGFALSSEQAKKINSYSTDFIKYNPYENPFVRPDSSDWRAGEKIIQKDLAQTLRAIKAHKAAGFYEGPVAKLLVDFMTEQKGLITQADLANYKAIWREPIQAKIMGYDFYTMPPPSSGGVALVQLLKGSMHSAFSNPQINAVESVHYITELTRRVYADRATHLGDADFYPVPVDTLIDDDYLKERYSNIDLERKTDSEAIKSGAVKTIEHFETTHFSITDQFGNAVAITTTLNGNYGCKVWVPGAGFFLNNEMDDFSVKPGVPNQFGLVGAEANKIEPQKRMLSSMTPTLIFKDDNLVMLLGANGGSMIITSVYQVILNVLKYNMNIQAAVNAPRMHAQWLPDKIFIEKEFLTAEALAKLKTMGHEFDTVPQFGKVNAIYRDSHGTFQGASDYKRGDDTALGLNF